MLLMVLYWKFIEDNINFFKKNPRLALIKIIEKLNKDNKKMIFKKANEFIETNKDQPL